MPNNSECCYCLENNIKEWYTLKCCHEICKECRHSCMASNNYTCPLCRQLSPYDGDKDYIYGNVIDYIDFYYSHYDPPVILDTPLKLNDEGHPDFFDAAMVFVTNPKTRYVVMKCTIPFKRLLDVDIILNIKGCEALTFNGRPVDPKVFSVYPLFSSIAGWSSNNFEGVTDEFECDVIYLNNSIRGHYLNANTVLKNNVYMMCGGMLGTHVTSKQKWRICLSN